MNEAACDEDLYCLHCGYNLRGLARPVRTVSGSEGQGFRESQQQSRLGLQGRALGG